MGNVVDQVGGFGQNILDTTGKALGLGPTAKPEVSGYAPSPEENAFTQALMARYNGTAGPSAAQMQMQQGLGVANQNANALAASQRGVSPALAAKMAANTQASNQQSVLQNSGILGAQESNAAGTNLANLYASQRQSASAANQLQASVSASQGKNLMAGIGMGSQAAGMMALGGTVGGDYHGALLSLDSMDAPTMLKKKKKDGGEGGMSLAGGPGDTEGVPGLTKTMTAAHGGRVPIIVSPGEKILSPQESERVASGDKGPLKKANVPGKAKVSGDSLENDNVPVKAQAGSTVIPRTANENEDKAQEFVAKLKDRGSSNERPKSYGDVLSKQRKLEERVKELESKLKKK